MLNTSSIHQLVLGMWEGTCCLKQQEGEEKKYLYYIFMDDDIVLQTKTRKNPWRVFEDFLMRTEPAVGIVDVTNNLRLPRVYESRKQRGCSLNETSDYIPTVHFDSAFNAFHYQAVDHILPYPCTFDNISWWFSGWYAIIKCEIVFSGQVVLHTELIANNPKHRPYPRKLLVTNTSDFYAILNKVEVDLPEEYQNAHFLLEWKKDGIDHQKLSSTICLPPPPRMPIKPFAYLDRRSET